MWRGRSSSSGCSDGRRGRSRLPAANIVEAADGTYAIGAVADVKVELFGDASGIVVARLPQ
jgi:hypothetical protein